jgi:hypothetical protein
MPGLAFHVETLKAANPPGLAANPQAATLGALGPDIFRFVPPSPTLASALGPSGALMATTGGVANLSLLQGVLEDPTSFLSLTPAQQAAVQAIAPLLPEIWAKPVSTLYSLLFGPSGLNLTVTWPVLAQAQALLDTLSTIIQAQDEIGLVEQISSVSGLTGKLSAFAPLAGNLTSLLQNFAFIAALGPWEEEPDFSALSELPGAPAFPSQEDQAGCRLYEFLRWHRSGDFATNLMKLAKTTAQKAFAEGWVCHLAASVTAEPFINNIVGGPYRTHWWRNMLVQNYVDSWIFGFVETGATMSGDTPTPDYEAWTSVCGANLQEMFNIAGSLSVPSPTTGIPAAVAAMVSGDISTALATAPPELEEISKLFDEALKATYPLSELGQIGATGLPSVGTSFSQHGLLPAAFTGAFAVYWFLTSGTGPFGNDVVGSPPSAACGMTPPSFISSGTAPSPASVINTPGAACAVIFAILALLALLTGDLPGALAALAVAMSAPVINWDQVACDLWWVTKQLIDGPEMALRDMLVFGGLAYPAPILLGGQDVNGNTQPATDLSQDPNLQQAQPDPTGNVAPTMGVPLTRTNSLRTEKDYPAALDISVGPLADLDFQSYPSLVPPPSVPTETPGADALIPSGEYAVAVFGTPLAHGGILGAGGTYPTSAELLGGAVANAKQALAAGGGIPNYNLDGDRGYGWLGWHPESGTDLSTPPVHDERDG